MRTGEGGELKEDLNEQWMTCWSKIVARAWVDEDFRKSVLAADAPRFRQICLEMGFLLPERIEMTVKSPEDKVFQYRSGRVGPLDTWVLPPVKIELVLPPTPPANQQAIAMVDYLRKELALLVSCWC